MTGFAVCAALTGALTAQAHPGHGLSDANVIHLLTSVDHLLVLGAAGVAMLVGARLVRRQLPRRALQFGGAAMLAAAFLLSGART